MPRIGLARTALIGLVACGGYLRLHDLGAREISPDESFSWRIIRHPPQEFFRRLVDDVHPPFYYLALKCWAGLFGESLPGLRGLSAAAGCLTIVLSYSLAAGLARGAVRGDPARDPGGGAWAGVLAAGLVAVHPFQVIYGRSARMYALGTLLAVLSTYCLLLALQHPRRARLWACYVASASAMLYTHYYLLFTFAAQAGFSVWRIAPSGRRDRNVAAAALLGTWSLVGILMLPWLPVALGQARDVWRGYWIPELTPGYLLSLLGQYVAGIEAPPDAASLVGWAVAGGAGLFVAVRPTRAGDFPLALLAASVPWAAAVGLSLLGGRPILVERYLVFSQVFFLLSVAGAVTLFDSGAARLGMATLLLANCLRGTVNDPRQWPGHDPGLATVARRIAAGHRPGDVVVAGSPATCNQLLYGLAASGSPIRCLVVGRARPGPGHRIHASSIPEDSWVAADEVAGWSGVTLWYVGTGADPSTLSLSWPRPAEQFIEVIDGREWVVKKIEL